MTRAAWIGVDIGGTKTAVVLSVGPPEILHRVEFATLPEHGPQTAIARILHEIHAALAAHPLPIAAVAGIGVSCGGPLDRHTGVIQSPPNLPTWDNIPIRSILEREFDRPCAIENDANAGAVAEHRYGAGQGTRNMVFLTMGTGLGAGLILDERLYRGSSEMGGEVGHVRLTRSGPVGYNKAGSAEGWASGGGMVQVAAEFLARAAKRGRSSLLFQANDHGAKLTARDIAHAAQQGDPLAQAIVRATGKRLGQLLAILVDLLNPERIVVGGLAMRLGDSLLQPARAVIRKECLARAVEACQVVPAQLGERIGDVAALCVAQGL